MVEDVGSQCVAAGGASEGCGHAAAQARHGEKAHVAYVKQRTVGGVPQEEVLLLEAWGPAEGGGHAVAQARHGGKAQVAVWSSAWWGVSLERECCL